jgi:crotonobetainyl-CoA:carnitine CoA-transferase CaiB-like acyl-CoA transferase
MSGTLEGIRVIDFTRVLAGPLASMILADMGAEVIKVEECAGGDLFRSSSSIHLNGEGVNFLSANRNKKSITLDITKPEGYRILTRLIESADVFLENYRPGVTDKLRIDYDSLRAINPRLIYGSITGFGTSGPYRNRAAVDPIIQAESGMMSLTGEENGAPVRIGSAVGDIYGAMLCAQGVGFALFARERSGVGQKVELSLLDAAVFGLIPREGEYFATGTVFPRMGSAHPQFVPFQNFATLDGHVFIAAFHDALFRKLCEALGRADLAAHADYQTNAGRGTHRKALLAVIEPLIAARTSDHWITLLEPTGIPIGRINDLAAVFEHPQVLHNDMLVHMEHPVAGPIKVVNNPLRFSANPTAMRSAPPLLGQHTDEVLATLGIEGAELARLREQGVV